jgi:hypothetical protein
MNRYRHASLQELFGPALAATIKNAALRPKLLLPDCDPEVMSKFMRIPAIYWYLRAGGSLETLCKLAGPWLLHGKQWQVADLYQRRINATLQASGQISQLKPRDRYVHDGILMLAYDRNNARVVASLRYLAELLRVQFDDNAYPSALRNNLKRLETKDLIEIISGSRNPQRSRSSIISVARYLEPVYVEPTLRSKADVQMKIATHDALAEFSNQRKAANVSPH